MVVRQLPLLLSKLQIPLLLMVGVLNIKINLSIINLPNDNRVVGNFTDLSVKVLASPPRAGSVVGLNFPMACNVLYL